MEYPVLFRVAAVTSVCLFLAAARRTRRRRAAAADAEHAAEHVHAGYVSGLCDLPLPAGTPKRLKLEEAASNLEGEQVAASLVSRLTDKVESGRGPIIVGIAGGTGSGKTTLARAVYESLNPDNVTYICHDQYYRDLRHISKTAQAETNFNFDHPDSLETELLIEHLQLLRQGNTVQLPTYDFKTHSRCASPATMTAEPRRVVLLEGECMLLFSDEALRKEIDIKIFVDTDADVRLIRRMKRDTVERGRTVESVIKQYLATVRPMHEQYVEPSRRHCDMIVPIGLNAVALDLVVSRLRFAIGH
ncbi:P-loop containing nucleoside triphosphate hydrolase protein [Tribonema minus]|uniref:Uridine kinase n=1 Tax=Tribonema minus TaxID=303371 RepID=A0A836CBP6_9STRA|nr:P-loop containing nucleoside triphosphate hydrolase protein [Tribonema minus]